MQEKMTFRMCWFLRQAYLVDASITKKVETTFYLTLVRHSIALFYSVGKKNIKLVLLDLDFTF